MVRQAAFVERLLDLIKIVYNMENTLQRESREDKRQLMGFGVHCSVQ